MREEMGNKTARGKPRTDSNRPESDGLVLAYRGKGMGLEGEGAIEVGQELDLEEPRREGKNFERD